MIEREQDPDNRRSVTVRLTERGRALVSAARPAYAVRAQRLAAGLPAGDASALARHLAGWLEFFEPDQRTAPRLGVAVATAGMAKRMRRAVGLPDEAGVLVLRVGRDTPAQAAGIARGDLITEAGGTAVSSVGDLSRAVRAADGSLSVKTLRGAEPREFEVTLAG
jgi:S1-C subfamily serine protease